MASQGDNEVAIDNSNSKPNTEKKSLKLKDLDVEVLVKIFKHLLVDDFVNIVEYDGDLKTAALSAFKEKLGKDAITVTNEFSPHTETSSSSVKLLNHFGNEITKLVVYYEEDYCEISKIINDAIISRCSKTLQEIDFENAGRFTMLGICMPFENVHTVRFLEGQLSEIVSQFGRWFPRAHTLKLHQQHFSEYCDDLNIEINPYLKNLEIGKLNDWHCANEFLKKFIELCPGLDTLRIELGGGERSISDILINTNMPNLENLHLKIRHSIYFYHTEREELNFQKLKNLTIEYKYPVLKDLPITTNNLQSLKLVTSEGFSKDCGKFLIDNKNVEFVQLVGPYIFDANDVISSISKLSNLKEIQFPFPYFHIDKVIQLDQIHVILKECKRLYKLNVHAENVRRKYIPGVESSMNTFAAAVDLQWKSCVTKLVVNDAEIHYRLSLEKKESDRTSRMEQRLKRKTTTSLENRNASKKMKTMKKHLQLENLNDDCLIVIFKHLSIVDLVHIVQYNNHFITAALVAFKHNYRNDQIEISIEYNSMTKAPLWCVELLKYFASEITKLRVKYYKEDSREVDDSIDNAIIKYCHKYLKEIQFIDSKTSTMSGINKPFENVCTVTFVGGSVSEKVYDLGKWFPKANTLKFENMDEAKELHKIHIKTAPALEHLEVRFHADTDFKYDKISARIIHSNPQLKSLYHKNVRDYDSDYDYDEDEDYENYGMNLHQTFVNLIMPNLESLTLILPNEDRITDHDSDFYYDEIADENELEDGKYHFKNLKFLHIEFNGSGVLKNLPILTNNLETLILVGSATANGSDYVRFIRDNRNVKSIKLVGRNSDILKLCELFPTLPRLNELEFSYEKLYTFLHGSFPLDALLMRCVLLQQLVVHCRNQNDCQEIDDQFKKSNDATKTAWNLTTNENHLNKRVCFTFKRCTI